MTNDQNLQRRISAELSSIHREEKMLNKALMVPDQNQFTIETCVDHIHSATKQILDAFEAWKVAQNYGD